MKDLILIALVSCVILGYQTMVFLEEVNVP